MNGIHGFVKASRVTCVNPTFAMSVAVGIDLGTTHTALACSTGTSAPTIVRVLQHVGPKEIDARSLLPSALYLPLEGESDEKGWVVGQWAYERAQAVPERGILSAKSWLSHAGVNRSSAILPWGSDGPRLSPLDASRRILALTRASLVAGSAPSSAEDATVVVTIPASFDPFARELTLDAAQSIFGTVTLLDEPIAAFLAVSQEERDGLRARSKREGRPLTVLVCDVGGGTSDFCLLSIDGAGPIERVATGRHLLLGGDNIDLSLAHIVERKLSTTFEPLELRTLVSSCRLAKEQLLSGSETAQVTIARRGAKLVGNTLRAELTHGEVAACILDGFFPCVSFDAAPAGTRHALTALGLPYERDPAITKHLAAFLRAHLAPGSPVDAVLFNGGTMTPESVRGRVMEALRTWLGCEPLALAHHSLDMAVAIGAAAHARSERLKERAVRIRAPRSYYLDVGGGNAVSILARGTIDDDPQTVSTSGLKARLGTKVRLDLYAADDARIDEPGSLARIDELERVSRLTTVLTGSESAVVPIGLTSAIDGTGRIAVTVHHLDHTFALAFDLEKARDDAVLEVDRHAGVPDAIALIDAAFGKARPDRDDRAAKDLVRNLEGGLGDRGAWNGATLRALADALIARSAGRRRSVEHERVFWLLAGYCIRPGYGYADDQNRIAALAKCAAERLQYPTEARGWQQLLTALRRMGAGASADLQAQWFEWLAPFVAPASAGLKKPKKGHPVSAETELLALFASLERLPAAARIAFAEWLLERAFTDRDTRIWQALTRVGLRELIYTDASYVLPGSEVSRWLAQLLREPWDETRARAAALLAHKTSDRVRDVDGATRDRVRTKLLSHDSKWVALLDGVHAERQNQDAWGGDTLPVGLILDL